MDRKSPEETLGEFLAEQPSWLQKILQLDYSMMSDDEVSAWYQSDWWWRDTQGRVDEEYRRLLQQCPDRWRAYCKRQKERALSDLPSAPSGRPRKDALAYEAIMLKRGGLSYSKIAIKLNSKYGPDTTTPGAVRQLIASRKHRST
jgi:hypothetical protein